MARTYGANKRRPQTPKHQRAPPQRQPLKMASPLKNDFASQSEAK
jgi:hypothetical protein